MLFRTSTTSCRTAAIGLNQARTFMSKATFIGRLGQVPEKATTSNGIPYYRYALAVSKPPKRDAEGKVIIDESGFPVRESSWFTIFSFNERAEASLQNLAPGTLLYVEANIDANVLPPTSEGAPPNKTYLFRESSHKVLSRPNK
ncbi:uncharacterized protein L203_105850 [Cryptococcus depauperatus CBS 7841]|uniref:Uncharacterized protein n=1 Tax=Cryptococcus depauperatus CBS 7841 TaxID=1295531 RepID=A0AAJ8JYE9_9TREE